MKRVVKQKKIPEEKEKSWWLFGIATLIIILILLFVGCENVLEKIAPARAKKPDALTISLGSENSMNSLELAFSLALAVKSDESAEAVYNSIPLTQTDGMDETDFYQYIQALKRGVSGSITDIKPINTQDKNAIIALLEAGDPNILQLAQNSDYYLLSYDSGLSRIGGFVIAIQNDENNQPYLDKDWMQGIVAINNYMLLYFDSIANNDFEALHALLKERIKPRNPVEEMALISRCQATLDYYNNDIRTQREQYDLLTIYPGYAEIEQYIVTLDQNQKSSRLVRFQELNNQLIITDPVSVTLDKKDLTVFTANDTLFTLDPEQNTITVSSQDFDRLLGTPLSHDDSTCYRTSKGKDIFTVEYPGIIISVSGKCQEDHHKWSGQLTRAEIYYSNFELGSGLKPGMHISELYVRYPFARENNYIMHSSINETDYTLAVQVESGNITKLTIIVATD